MSVLVSMTHGLSPEKKDWLEILNSKKDFQQHKKDQIEDLEMERSIPNRKLKDPNVKEYTIWEEARNKKFEDNPPSHVQAKQFLNIVDHHQKNKAKETAPRLVFLVVVDNIKELFCLHMRWGIVLKLFVPGLF